MPKKNSDRAPLLGIFWLVGGKLIFDKSHLNEAEHYADHLTHPHSHVRVWAKLERTGQVPQGSEYDEFPRGRVTYHPASGESTLLADRCILDGEGLVVQIKKALHLGKKVKIGTDLHYRCPRCLRGKRINEEEDWGS